ncbi:MAG: cell division protein ZipA, partial [Gammaproteobacteria bacterium]|nr:cell division protein ZipA [Gammaproteobacteria bacterium]
LLDIRPAENYTDLDDLELIPENASTVVDIELVDEPDEPLDMVAAEVETESINIAPADETDTPVLNENEAASANVEMGEEWIVVLYVVARSGQSFSGAALWDAFSQAGLRFGEMDIYHMPGSDDASSVFSVASMMEPGTFYTNNQDDYETPGVVLFMRLPASFDAEQIFGKMLATARLLAQQLEGDIKDETHSTLTQQTISHIRERIAAYQFKQQQTAKSDS